MSARSEVDVLERMIRPGVGDIPADAAQFFLSLDFPEFDQTRIDELSAKARAGALSTQDKEELDQYIHLGDFLALIQSKARRSLGNSRATPTV
jgi:hypothetical protein